MNIMVSKDDCVNAINKFIRSKSINDAVVLLEYLCDIKDLPNKQEALNALNNPALISMLMPRILEELEIEFNLTRLTDRNNNLILVFNNYGS